MCARYTLFWLAAGLVLLYSRHSIAAENVDFRDAWAKQLDEYVGVAYRAKGEWLTRTAEGGQEQVQKGNVLIEARMRCDARKFRFDLRAEAARGGGLYVFDGEGFHSCAQTSAWDWTVDSSRETSAQSDWPFVYPLL